MTAADVRHLLKIACRDAGSQQAWAYGVGVSPAYVTDVLIGRRDPGASILDALGLRKIVTYETIDPAA